MRVAIAHDWLNGMRGGEKVLESLLDLFPSATIFTLFHERGRVSARIEAQPIVTSWLDRVPGVYKHYRRMLPLFPFAAASLRLTGFDVVISSSHAAAKAVHTGSAVHVCYCHTPMRYIWDAETDYGFTPLDRAALSLIRSPLRRWDTASARRVHQFVANSTFVAERIRRVYGRDAVVIPPPIDVQRFSFDPRTAREDFYLTVGTAPYKRHQLVAAALSSMPRRLVVVGPTPAGNPGNAEHRGWVDDHELESLYRRARAVISAAREDFGIVFAEALAAGCPVIACRDSGARDIIRDDENGILFDDRSPAGIRQAVARFESKDWPPAPLRASVLALSPGRFLREMSAVIDRSVAAMRAGGSAYGA